MNSISVLYDLSSTINAKYKTDDYLLSLLERLSRNQSTFDRMAHTRIPNEDREDRLREHITPIDDTIYDILKHMTDNAYNSDDINLAQSSFANIINYNHNNMNDNTENIGHEKIRDFIQRIKSTPTLNQSTSNVPKFNYPTSVHDIYPLKSKELQAIGTRFITRLKCYCGTNYVNMVLIPCGHLVCSTCAKKIQLNNSWCSKCSNLITNINDIYYQKYLKYKNKYLSLKNKN